MDIFVHNVELFLTYVVELCTILLEFFGVIVLVYTAVKCFIQWIRRESNLRLDLAQGIALSLELSGTS